MFDFLASIPLIAWVLLMGGAVFFWLLLFGNQGLYEFENLRHLKADFTHQKEILQRNQKELKKELENLNNPEYLKHLIHKELGYVADDEMIVKFPPTKKP